MNRKAISQFAQKIKYKNPPLLVKKVDENNPECYEQVTASLGHGEASRSAVQARKAVQQNHVPACLRTYGTCSQRARSQWQIWHWEKHFFFFLTPREVCPLLLYPMDGTTVIWHNPSSSSKKCSYQSDMAGPSANQKGLLDWVAVLAKEWEETTQKYKTFAKTLGYAITAFRCMLGHAGSFGQAPAPLSWAPTPIAYHCWHASHEKTSKPYTFWHAAE